MLFDGLSYQIKSSGGHCLCEDCCRQRPERAEELKQFIHLATTTSAGRYWRKRRDQGYKRPSRAKSQNLKP